MKPLNPAQARILRTRINATKAGVFRLQDEVAKLTRAGIEGARMQGLREALSKARSALEDADNACVGVEIDDIAAGGSREPVERPRRPASISFERHEDGRLHCDECDATFDDNEQGGDALYSHECVSSDPRLRFR